MIDLLLVYLCIMLASGLLTLLIRAYDKTIPKSYRYCYCDSCKHKLKWWESNLPIFNFILLKGKCSYCGEKISPLIPVLELNIGFYFYIILRIVIL